MPLTKRMAKIATPVKKPQPKPQSKPKAKPKVKAKDGAAAAKEAPKKRKPAEDDTEPPPKRKRAESKEKDEGKDAKWTTLSHSGVLFPPEYVAHGVKMNYDGRPVDLTAEQEEASKLCIQKTIYMQLCHFIGTQILTHTRGSKETFRTAGCGIDILDWIIMTSWQMSYLGSEAS